MVTAKQVATVAALIDVEAGVIAYLEAASGGRDQALRWAVEDLLQTEQQLQGARRSVSYGYVRARLGPCNEERVVGRFQGQ